MTRKVLILLLSLVKTIYSCYSFQKLSKILYIYIFFFPYLDGIARVELELGKLRDNTKLRPSNEALRKAAQELEKNNNILLGSQINFGNIKELLRGKIQEMKF